jgi:hypothetical protein
MGASPTSGAKREDVLQYTLPRFFAHWVAATLGFWFHVLLPLLQSWTDPAAIVAYPRWWAVLLVAAIVSLVGGILNSNLPPNPVELLKSAIFGFALESATVLVRSHVV